MGALDLRRAMGPATIPAFDYATVANADVRQKMKETATKIRDLQRVAVIDIGRALLAVKDGLEHGQFLDWIEAEFAFGRRTAVNMMQVAATFGDKWESVSRLPPTVLYLLAAPSTPTVVRDAVFDLQHDEVITPRGIKAAIEAVKKAEAPKKPSLKQAEREAQREEEARRRASVEKADRERDREQRAREAATVRMKAVLADKMPELSDIFGQVQPYTFGDIVRKLVEQYRPSTKPGALL